MTKSPISLPYSWPFTCLSLVCPCLLWTGEPRLDTGLQVWTQWCWAEEKDRLCLVSCTWGWTTAEFGEGDPWKINQLSWTPLLPRTISLTGWLSCKEITHNRGFPFQQCMDIIEFSGSAFAFANNIDIEVLFLYAYIGYNWQCKLSICQKKNHLAVFFLFWFTNDAHHSTE